MYVYRQPYGNELYHHGILGMKWGVRRYQNADGTLTAAGKSRYQDEYGALTMEGNRRYKTGDPKRQKKMQKDAKKGKFDLEAFNEHERRVKEESPWYWMKDKKTQLLGEAKAKEMYNIDYLEFVDDETIQAGGDRMLKDYESFIDDPQGYLERRYAH